jgi:hypothetical protein
MSQAHDDRRRAPRVDVRGRLDTRLEPPAQSVTVRDISVGGFLIESPEPFPVDAIHQFRVAAPDGGWEEMLTARSVHCRAHGGDGASRYFTGFAFLHPTGPEARSRIMQLIDQVTSVVTYDEPARTD